MRVSVLGRFMIAVGLVFVAALTVSAGANVNPRKGKAMFKKNCRVCHDGKTADVPSLQPADRIADQWERAFKNEEDVTECLPRVKEKSGTEMTEQDLADIEAYLVEYAADSEQPATCG